MNPEKKKKKKIYHYDILERFNILRLYTRQSLALNAWAKIEKQLCKKEVYPSIIHDLRGTK